MKKVICSHFTDEKARLWEVKDLTQDHSASKERSNDPNSNQICFITQYYKI